MSHTDYILVGDIGGTNARFGLADPETCVVTHQSVRQTADFPHIEDAIRDYLATDAGGHRTRRAAIAVACPVGNDHINLTNNHWEFSVSALREAMKWDDLQMLNDFTAQALAIPHLPASDITRIGPDVSVASPAPLAVLGPGTGLGVSGLIPNGHGGWIALSGEGGHVGIVAENEQEVAILRHAWEAFGRSSLERLVCGSGIVFLHGALAKIRGEAEDTKDVGEIVRRGLSDESPLAVETLNQFCAFLGGFAGDTALLLGARGGVYIAGGVVPRLGDFFAESPFRTRFENKGRFAGYTAAIPTFVIAPHENPALIGAASVYGQ